ncbi:MAG: hypothetical protein WC798_03405 [Candidatus Paceibacterota bacterium]|jgi:hypothetical protein
MKIKRVCCVAAVLFLLAGCGGGGGAGGGSVTGAAITTVPITTTVPPTRIELAAVPASDLIETINVLVNKDFADAHPELTANVTQIIADVNTVLAKDPANGKRYRLGQIMTYPDAAALYTIGTNPAYFLDNNLVGNKNYGGTTVVYWVSSDSSLPTFFKDMGGGTGYASGAYHGKSYGLIFVADSASSTVLLGKDKLMPYVNGLNSYWVKLSAFIHELLHTYGLGIPEWYALKCTDMSGTKPNLAYNMQARFPMDPMSVADVLEYNIQEYKLHSFHSWWVSNNTNHQLPGYPRTAAQKVKILVKVVDAASVPVPNATITIYGGIEETSSSSIARDMTIVLQSASTDANGMTDLRNDFDLWSLTGVKASFGEKYAGAVITSVDLEDVYFRQKQDQYVLTLTLQ